MNDTKNTFLRFDATELDEPSLKIVLQELGETEESRMKGLWILREELKNFLAQSQRGLDMGYPFLPKKIQERVFIHPNDNWKSLHAHFPADILPEKYGGNLNDSSMLNFIEYFGLENLEEKFHKKLEYGLKKTKHRRLALKVLH
ncbi:hypothetical protein HNY73_014804 [Argiope bruennichi]|uniref:CRAL-TRIO domain-containing protein n=1 Tax=Argiope bruennichi TaxID=94029 RepID=A0A8T0ERQ6_ARGBR|nr:hypothetical protein HNY73_014804 [Argiope bruennichi]